MLPTFESGMPDRQVLFLGASGFAEIKAPGKKPRPLQVSFLNELGKAGSFVGVVDSYESALQWIEDFKDHVELLTQRPIPTWRPKLYERPTSNTSFEDILNSSKDS